MEKKFVGASYEAFDDPYAELKQNSTENRIKISKQSIGNQKQQKTLQSHGKRFKAHLYMKNQNTTSPMKIFLALILSEEQDLILMKA